MDAKKYLTFDYLKKHMISVDTWHEHAKPPIQSLSLFNLRLQQLFYFAIASVMPAPLPLWQNCSDSWGAIQIANGAVEFLEMSLSLATSSTESLQIRICYVEHGVGIRNNPQQNTLEATQPKTLHTTKTIRTHTTPKQNRTQTHQASTNIAALATCTPTTQSPQHIPKQFFFKLTWLVLGGDPAARSHRVEQFTALWGL